MSAPALAGTGPPTLRIRGTAYPVLLPTIRDPRLHLAAIIISLQILGQVAFDFRLSIAQILISIVTCAVLEVGITFFAPAHDHVAGERAPHRERRRLHPPVPGTEHGDWWSLHGWWIFAGTAAVSLLSKYIVVWKGRHIFNPSNFGLVACFLILGSAYAEPLDFWWGPMSVWLALALAIIVTGGFAILSRLHLVGLAAGFWIAFAGGIAVLAASGHAMTARWHLGPIADCGLLAGARLLARDPRLPLLHDHRPADRAQRTHRAPRVRRVGSGCSPCCSSRRRGRSSRARSPCSARSRSSARRVRSSRRSRLGCPLPALRRPAAGALALVGVAAFAGLVVLAGIPARSSASAVGGQGLDAATLPEVTVVLGRGRLGADRREHGTADRPRRRREPGSCRRRAARARHRPSGRGCGRSLAREPAQPDRRRGRPDDRRPRVHARHDARDARARRGPRPAEGDRDCRGDGRGRDLRGGRPRRSRSAARRPPSSAPSSSRSTATAS